MVTAYTAQQEVVSLPVCHWPTQLSFLPQKKTNLAASMKQLALFSGIAVLFELT